MPLQRALAKVIGKKLGKTSIRDSDGKRLAKVKKGTELDVDSSRRHELPGQEKQYFKVSVESEEDARSKLSPCRFPLPSMSPRACR